MMLNAEPADFENFAVYLDTGRALSPSTVKTVHIL